MHMRLTMYTFLGVPHVGVQVDIMTDIRLLYENIDQSLEERVTRCVVTTQPCRDCDLHPPLVVLDRSPAVPIGHFTYVTPSSPYCIVSLYKRSCNLEIKCRRLMLDCRFTNNWCIICLLPVPSSSNKCDLCFVHYCEFFNTIYQLTQDTAANSHTDTAALF